MKRRLALGLVATTLLTLLAVRTSTAQTTTFKGEITDEHLNCVQTPIKAVEGIKDKTACILYWAHSVQPGSKYVLYDAATKTTYQLDDQVMVQPYIAAKVEVTGTLNVATKTIKVTGIKVP